MCYSYKVKLQFTGGMDMAMIRGIVFDFGGVISAPKLDEFFAQVEQLTGWTREMVWDGWMRHRAGLDKDFVTVEELYRLIAADFGHDLPVERLREIGRLDYEAWAPPNPETYVWAQELKAAGYKIGILTNMPTEFIPWFDRCAAPFRALADAEVISGEEHLVKPDPEIYDIMAQRMGLPPEQLLFFDDSAKNVEAAIAYGWHAHQFTTVQDAREALSQL